LIDRSWQIVNRLCCQRRRWYWWCLHCKAWC